MISYRVEPRHYLALVLAVIFLAVGQHGHSVERAAPDPLPSWQEGKAKSAILDFVQRATTDGNPDFVLPGERIAVFDMDGTLIPEKPLPGAVLPIIEDVRAAAGRNPALAAKPAVAALLAGDIKGVEAAGQQGMADIIAAAVDNRTTEEVAAGMANEERTAMHPVYHRPYLELAYRPMIEVLTLLRAHGFQIWICSGSPVAYVRGMSMEAFGVDPTHVIGSSLSTSFTERAGHTVLIYTGGVERLVDRDTKPPAINLAIGKRPVFVAGNVGGEGDIAMMRYSHDRPGASFQLLVNHDDAKREFSYTEKSGASLAAAARHGFAVASIARDWKVLYIQPDDPARRP
jgi:phosphoserine phosphatase